MREAHRAQPVRYQLRYAGVAEVWATTTALFAGPTVIGNVVWILAAVVWALTIVTYSSYIGVGPRLRADLVDPVFAPFVAVVTIVPMLLGTALAAHARTAGVTIFTVALVATIALGGWLIGQWIVADLTLQQWHPGYFLPTVAGGYLGRHDQRRPRLSRRWPGCCSATAR